MSTSTDDASHVTPPTDGAVFVDVEAGAAGTVVSEIELVGLVAGQYVHFYSKNPFYLLLGKEGLAAPNEATASTPAAPVAGACWDCAGGAVHPFRVGTSTRFFRWKTQVQPQTLRYYYASPGGA